MTILKNSSLKILQAFVLFFPISFVFGNFSINLVTILISLIGIAYYNKKLFVCSDKVPLYLVSAFFFIVIFSSYYQNIFYEDNKDSIKSLFFLRYLLLLFVLKTMIFQKDLNIKYFLIICFLVSSIISLDILIQFYFGKNIFGYEPIELSRNVKYYTSIFGKELIAGGFIQMFAIPGIFAIFFISKKVDSKLTLYIIFFLFVFLFLTSLILAGNRMPVIMFVFFLIFLSLIIKIKNKKNIFLSTSLAIILIFSLIIYNSDTLKKRSMNFLAGVPSPSIIIKELKKEYPNLKKYENTGKQFHSLIEFKTTPQYENYPFFTGHLPIFITSIDLFFEDPIKGGGIKSYRNNCYKKVHLPNRVCESHPHNFTLDILNDTGFLGFLLIYTTVIYLLYNNYKDYQLGDFRKTEISNWIYLGIILSLVTQFFPFKSSGSFFSTFNAAYTFFLLGISFGLNELKQHKYT